MHGVSVLYHGVRVGVGGVINYEGVIHVSCIECYVFGV